MNGEINPNANRMGGFGKGKNYMQSGGGGGVNMADILPQDPFKKENAEKNSRWNTQSKQAHEQRQAQLKAEQDQFVPESFKKGGAMNLDIKGNKSQGKATTWLDNNSKLDSNNPNDPQNTGSSNNQNNNNNNFNNNQNNNPYGNNNNNPYGNNNNNNPYGNNNMNNNNNNFNNNNNGGFGGNNNMNNNMNNNNNNGGYGGNNNMSNNNFNNNNNNGGFGGGNNMNNNNNSQPQNISFNPNPNNNNNGGFGGNNNNNMNSNNNNNFGGGNNNNNIKQNTDNKNWGNYDKVDPNINRAKGPTEQPMPQPYYSNKQKDPFAKFLDNSQYQRDLKNHGHQSHGGYNMGKKPNYNQKPKVNNGDLYHTGNKESPYMLPTPNKFSQPIRSICAACGKPITDAWTEDAKGRMYHNECFVCIECGVKLGALGKYVTIGRGVVCKPCRNKQVLAAQAQEKY